MKIFEIENKGIIKIDKCINKKCRFSFDGNSSPALLGDDQMEGRLFSKYYLV